MAAGEPSRRLCFLAAATTAGQSSHARAAVRLDWCLRFGSLKPRRWVVLACGTQSSSSATVLSPQTIATLREELEWKESRERVSA